MKHAWKVFFVIHAEDSKTYPYCHTRGYFYENSRIDNTENLTASLKVCICGTVMLADNLDIIDCFNSDLIDTGIFMCFKIAKVHFSIYWFNWLGAKSYDRGFV